MEADRFRALRHREYRLFFAGQWVSLVGTWMQSIAQGWLVYRITQDPALLTLVFFAGQIPTFLLGSLGGLAADRWEPRRLVMATQAGLLFQAAALGWLTLLDRIQVGHILVLAALMGIVNAFDLPARQVLVARVVPKEDLPNAIALNSSVFHGSRILGPSLAGLTVALAGEGWCFLLNSASYLAALGALACMRLPKVAPSPSGATAWAHLREGFLFVHRTPRMRRLFGLLAAVCFFGMPYVTLLPVVAKDVLNAGPQGLGWVMGAGGVGATFAALSLAVRKEGRGLEGFMLLAAASLGVALPAFAASRWLILSMVLILPVGFAMVTHMTSNNTLVQMEVPDALRGRVMALHSMVFVGAWPLGALVAGAAAKHWGAPWTLTVCGLMCALAAGVYAATGKVVSDPIPRQ